MMTNKKCMKCGNAATYKFVRIEGNQVYDMFYCSDHAAEASPYQKKTKMQLSQILATFLSQEQAAQAREFDPGLKCNVCGLPFSIYKKTLFLGCPSCYDSFFDQMLLEMRKIHGNGKHIGRKPGGGKETSEDAGFSIPIRPAGALDPPNLPEPVEVLPSSAEKKAEKKTPDVGKEIIELTSQMNKAIAGEDFEKAAQCRDKITTLRTQLKKEQA